ncbi:MAG: cupin domain-containing protein [Dermatophilus congolensis]|nr:cupin domain-containing protein [Dermatophilus congolensis]
MRKRSLAVVVAATFTLAGSSAAVAAAPVQSAAPAHVAAGVVKPDPGAVPYVFDIDKATLKNRNFRTAAWTADDLQVTLMSIPPGGDVGLEMHDDVDQFLRVESGTASVVMGDETKLSKGWKADAGDAIFVPSGTWHNIVNTGRKPLKLYSLYGPAAHPQGTVHRTQADDPHSGETKPTPRVTRKIVEPAPFTKDFGAIPTVFDVEAATLANTNFRTAAWSAPLLQLTLMSIPVGGDVGLEMHDDVDQFLRVESGMAKVYAGKSKDSLKQIGVVKPGYAILIPSGTWHNIVNLNPKKPLQLYSLYGPQQHPVGTIHKTQADDHH